MRQIVDEGEGNTVQVGKNVTLSGRIKGNQNRVVIGDAELDSEVRLIISGDRNTVEIGKNSRCRGLDIRIGNHVRAFEVNMTVGDMFTSEGECKILLYNSGNTLSIGSDCMFSNNIVVRCGESPHLIFDKNTGEYLDVSDGVKIGNHVWIGERCYITKRVEIPDECILAAQSVATRKFTEESCVIGGNPAKIVKRDVQWIRNRGALEKDSSFARSYRAVNALYNR